ncbi:MAG: TetR/AcrR family transcriptional regulator [Actinomycetales bacterium]|nr:TetR/AcrR family transcriptional regulator [Actinomycetales bacterium]
MSAERVDPRVLRSRAAVLAATVELLTERGVAATTIEAVADRSGVAKTTICRRWAHQHPLILDAFASVLPTPPTPDTGSLRSDLLALVTGLSRALTDNPAATLMPALIDAAERDPAFAGLHHQEAARRHNAVREVLDHARERGEPVPDIDPDDLLDALAGPLFHRRYLTGLPLDDALATRIVDRATDSLIERNPR